MIIIADSGATKTDWLFCEKSDSQEKGKGRLRVHTPGLNIATMSPKSITEIIDGLISEAGKEIVGSVDSIYFYGAGCIGEKLTEPLRNTITTKFPILKELQIESDLNGAAKALFADGTGVVAIMGTGSNSCLWENGKVKRNIRPGGFILGDEGSGACLGKMFLSDYFKELVPEEFGRKANETFGISYHDAVMNIYKGETPSRYLASFARFIVENKSEEYAAELIERNICNFIERCLQRYGENKVGVVGSLGYACREELKSAGSRYGLEFVRFLPSPIESLAEYHINR